MSLMYVDYRVRQRDYLIRLLKAMVSRLNLRAVLRMTLEGAVEMLYGSVGLVALRQPNGHFTFAATYGVPSVTAEAFHPLLEGIRYTGGKLLIPPELMEEVKRKTGLLLRQMVALPLVVERRLLGYLRLPVRHQVARFQTRRRGGSLEGSSAELRGPSGVYKGPIF